MALTITTAPRPDVYAVDVTVAGAAGAPVTITAAPLGQTPYTVRAIGTPTADPFTVTDYAAPFGVPIRYTARTASAVAVGDLSAPLDVTGCVLASTETPGRWVRPILLSDTPHEWQTRSVWFDIIGRRDPLVNVDVLRYRSGEWQVYVSGDAARADLLALLTPGAPIHLRTGPGVRADDAIVLPLTVTEEPHGPVESPGRVFTIAYQAVSRPMAPWPGVAGWVYASVPAAHATYADLLTAVGTYTALRTGLPTDPGTGRAFTDWAA